MPFRSDPTDHGHPFGFRPVVAPARWTLGWWANWLFVVVVFIVLPLLLFGLFVWTFVHPAPSLW